LDEKELFLPEDLLFNHSEVIPMVDDEISVSFVEAPLESPLAVALEVCVIVLES
jgi:hypothetical protein